MLSGATVGECVFHLYVSVIICTRGAMVGECVFRLYVSVILCTRGATSHWPYHQCSIFDIIHIMTY